MSGTRATGTGKGDFLLVPPGWSGEAASGVTVIHVPTRVASIFGSVTCAGEPDLPAVHALQDATTLEPADATAQPDDQGDQLTYTLRLDPPPPVGAFWSLTMYDIPHFFLVANDINRYSLGDRTPGIVFADDGSLTITLSHARPGDPTAALNWLPAPAGDFRPVLRMYEPAPEVLNETYTVPPITRS